MPRGNQLGDGGGGFNFGGDGYGTPQRTFQANKKNQTTLRRRRRKMASRQPLEVQLKELLKKY